MPLQTEIRKYLIANLLYVDDALDCFDDDTSLIGEGLIDSVGIMELIAYAQTVFGITVEQHEMTLDNFDSVNKLAAFIHRRLISVSSSTGTPAEELRDGMLA